MQLEVSKRIVGFSCVRGLSLVAAMLCFLQSASAMMAPISKLQENSNTPECIQVETSYVYKSNFGKDPAIQMKNGCARDVFISSVSLGETIENLKPAFGVPAIAGNVMHGTFFKVDANGSDCSSDPAAFENKKVGCKSFSLHRDDTVVIGVPFNSYYLVAGNLAGDDTASGDVKVRIQGKVSAVSFSVSPAHPISGTKN